MPPKKSSAQEYIIVKRHKSITFLALDCPASVSAIKSALLSTIRSAPGNPYTNSPGETQSSDIREDDVVLGHMSEEGKKNKQDIVKFEEDAEVHEKTIFWRLKDEDFHIEQYPEDEDDAEER